jgi:hypothetical protein
MMEKSRIKDRIKIQWTCGECGGLKAHSYHALVNAPFYYCLYCHVKLRNTFNRMGTHLYKCPQRPVKMTEWSIYACRCPHIIAWDCTQYLYIYGLINIFELNLYYIAWLLWYNVCVQCKAKPSICLHISLE